MTKRFESMYPTLRMLYLTALAVHEETAVLYRTSDDLFNLENGVEINMHQPKYDALYHNAGVVYFTTKDGHIHAYLQNGEVE